MNFTYTVRKADPKLQFLSVIYHADGYPDFFKNFKTTDFSAAKVQSLVDGFSPQVREYWEAYAAAPDTTDVLEGEGGSGVAYREVREDPPAFDPNTQRLESTETIDGDTKTLGWTVVDLPAEQQAANLIEKARADRTAKEGAGTVWVDGDGNQYLVDTTQESQNRFSAAMTAIANGLRPDGGKWKMGQRDAEGNVNVVFRPMANAELAEMSGLVLAHVQKCFDAESAVVDKIKAGVFSSSFDAEFEALA